MDQSKTNLKDEQLSEYLDRMQMFSRAGGGDDPMGSSPNPTSPVVAPPSVPVVTRPPASTIIITTSPPIPTVTTITTPPSVPIGATGGSINSLAQSNQPFLDSFFNNPNDARSEFGGITPESIPDVNAYQNKKTVAQGMMDIALFSANANQLRYVMESKEHPYFWTGVVLITISLILQVGVGVGLLINTRYNVKDKKEICIANKINNFTIVGIFLVTVINVFISAFGVVSGTTAAPIFLSPRFGNETESTEAFGAVNETTVDPVFIFSRFGNETESTEPNYNFE